MACWPSRRCCSEFCHCKQFLRVLCYCKKVSNSPLCCSSSKERHHLCFLTCDTAPPLLTDPSPCWLSIMEVPPQQTASLILTYYHPNLHIKNQIRWINISLTAYHVVPETSWNLISIWPVILGVFLLCIFFACMLIAKLVSVSYFSLLYHLYIWHD
jgi:hypothetical protein